MAIHELVTNASKYGALSADCGRVRLAWRRYPAAGGGERFQMTWTESDGPPVSPPATRGFGSAVTGDMIRASFDAEVETDFAATGLVWRLDCPAETVLARDPA